MEDIIRCIKQHPILYENKKTPNSVKKKRENWEEVALDLGQSVEAVKKKWVYLRESYLKCLRDGKAKKWQWAEEMEFLRPHLKNWKDDKNSTADEEQLNGTTLDAVDEQPMRRKDRKISTFASRPGTPTSDEEYETTAHKPIQTPTLKIQKPKHKAHKSENKVTKSEHKLHELATKREISSETTSNGPTPKKPRTMNSTLDSNASTPSTTTPWNPSFDATELLFLGYAKTLKNFALKNQAVAKMKIAKIIMEQELLQCDQDERRDSFLDGF